MNRIIKRTNPYSGKSEMLTRQEAMLHDTVKQAEEMQEYDKMQKALDKFSRLNPKEYMLRRPCGAPRFYCGPPFGRSRGPGPKTIFIT